MTLGILSTVNPRTTTFTEAMVKRLGELGYVEGSERLGHLGYSIT